MTSRVDPIYSAVLDEAWEHAKQYVEQVRTGVCGPYEKYKSDPIGFVQDVLQGKPWEMQRVGLEAIRDYQKVQFRTCRSSGKTDLIGSKSTPWLMCTAPTIVITSGPSESQLKDQVWSHINSVVSRSSLPGRCETLHWRIGPRHFAKGVTVGKTEESHKRALGWHAAPVVPDDPDSDPTDTEIAMLRDVAEMAGKKGIRLVYKFDECPGIDQRVLEAVKGSLVTDLVKLVLSGNPIMEKDEAHEFAYAQQDGSGYFRIMVGAEPMPDDAGADVRFTHVPTWLMSPKWIADRKAEWGEESSLTRSHVHGLYSNREDEADKVIPKALLESALAREAHSDAGNHAGADVSAGGDQFVVVRWLNGVKVDRRSWVKTTEGPGFLMEMVDRCIAICKEWEVPQDHFHFDKTGVGEGFHSRLHQVGFYADAVDFGGGVEGDWPELIKNTQLKNRRAELHWIFRRGLQEGLWHIPKEYTESWREAQWATYILKAEGSTGTTILIEPKDKLIAKYGHSPDDFDADLLAFSRVGNRMPRFRTLKRRF